MDMNAKKFLVALAPWLVFSVIANRLGADYVGVAALLACAGSIGLMLYGLRDGGVKLIELTGVVTFGAIAALGFIGGHGTEVFLAEFGRGGSALVLAAVMAISALTIPFTEQYAKQSVDPRYWGDPAFRAKNKAISMLWAGVVFAMAVCHLVAGALAASTGAADAHPGSILLNWIIPVVLILFATKRTRQMANLTSTATTTERVAARH
jgi:hypothetical protein